MARGTCPTCRAILRTLPWGSFELSICTEHHGFRIENSELQKIIKSEVFALLNRAGTVIAPIACGDCQEKMFLHRWRGGVGNAQCLSCRSCAYVWFAQSDFPAILSEQGPLSGRLRTDADAIVIEDHNEDDLTIDTAVLVWD